MKTNIKNHKHTWLVTSISIGLAVLLVVLIPEKKEYSLLLFGLAGGHFILVLIVIFSGWILIPQKIWRLLFKGKTSNGYDFGYSVKWIYSFLVASIIVFMLAIHVFFSLEGNEMIQLIVFTALLLVSVNLLTGFFIMQNSKYDAQLTLPMVNLLPSLKGRILDAGCGAGRTTIAVSKAYPHANIVAFDKFNADYIENGGALLINKNISFAGVNQQVEIQQGDITATPFKDNYFDSIISSFMFDHLGKDRKRALHESYRILKPGGRFLLIIAVRGVITFGIANFLSLLFPTRLTWTKNLQQAGFKVLSVGKINEGTYFLVEK